MRALNRGAPLRLIREPENAHGTDAVAVYDQPPTTPIPKTRGNDLVFANPQA